MRRFKCELLFGKRGRSCAVTAVIRTRFSSNTELLVAISESDMHNFFTNGIREYDSVKHHLALQEPLLGYEALHHLILHEMAHIFIKSMGLQNQVASHGKEFRACIAILYAEVPYGSI